MDLWYYRIILQDIQLKVDSNIKSERDLRHIVFYLIGLVSIAYSILSVSASTNILSINV
jgi:hypothetical protein